MAEEERPSAVQSTRAEHFSKKYANVVRYESTVHDLTIVFGQTDLSTGTEVAVLHTAITLPWSAVKILALHLDGNIIFQELQNGFVPIPPSQLPPPVQAPGNVNVDEALKEALNQVEELRQQFIAAQARREVELQTRTRSKSPTASSRSRTRPS